MKKRMAIRALCVMVTIFVIGFILILVATSIGSRIARNDLKNGKAMNAIEYERIVDTNVSTFRTGGIILSLVGGVGMLLSGVALYKEL